MRILITISLCLFALSAHGQSKKILVGRGSASKVQTAVIYDTIRNVTQVYDTATTKVFDTVSTTIRDTNYITVYDTNRTTSYDTNYATVVRDTTQIKTILTDSVTGGLPSAKSFSSYGAVPDDETKVDENLAAWQAFIDDNETITLLVGAGEWHFDTTLYLNKLKHILGVGNQHGGHATFQYPQDIKGFWFQGGADWSTMKNIKLRAQATYTDITADGIVVQAHGVKLEQVEVESFGGSGFNFSCGAATNCNSGYLELCRAVLNGGHGFRFGGSDANAISVIACDATNNKFNGFSDESFLGNYYYGCHTASNDSAGYRVTNANASARFVACYTEGDQPPNEIGGKSMAIDGTNGAGNEGTGGWMNSLYGGIVGNIFKTVRWINGSTAQTVALGNAGNGRDILSYTRTGDQPLTWNMRYDTSGTGQKIDISGGLYYMTNNTGFKLRLGNRDNAEKGDRYYFDKGFFLGAEHENEINGRYIGIANAVPTEGQWIAGDILFNATPVQGEPSYWQCTAGGTPGTWTGFNTIP